MKCNNSNNNNENEAFQTQSRRHKICFNAPFTQNVKTNISTFEALPNVHSKASHTLHEIVNTIILKNQLLLYQKHTKHHRTAYQHKILTDQK